jgi:pimeloyl-ACP methyl ester carboxylesterase
MQGQDWELFTRTITHAHLGWPAGSVASELAAAVRDTLAPQVVAAFDAAASTVDVTHLLGEVRAPTLVLHPREVAHPDPGNSRRLAAAIPDARMVLLDGASIAPIRG